MEEIRPTRAQLLALREQISTAQAGMELLKSKRDALLLEFMEVIESTMDLSDKLSHEFIEAQYSLELARAIDGEAAVHSAALASTGEVLVDIEGYKVMGVPVPVIKPAEARDRHAFSRGYSPTGVSVRVDDAATGFERAVDSILKYAESETRLRRLGAEISKTNRRVNALEQVRIPELGMQMRYIKQALDERSREELFRLKKVKKNIEKRKAAAQKQS